MEGVEGVVLSSDSASRCLVGGRLVCRVLFFFFFVDFPFLL